MSDKDFAVQSTTLVPEPGKMSNKPKYLIILIKKTPYFVTLDKPEYGSNIVQAKGFFIPPTLSEKDIKSNLVDLIASATKDGGKNIEEVTFVLDKVFMIKNLYFKYKS